MLTGIPLQWTVKYVDTIDFDYRVKRSDIDRSCGLNWVNVFISSYSTPLPSWGMPSVPSDAGSW